jgi:hypothetical protein
MNTAPQDEIELLASADSPLVATQYQFKTDFENHTVRPVTLDRMRSPFYKGERWAVRQGGNCLNNEGEWEYEPMPSSRDDDFYARCRFNSLRDAIMAMMTVKEL